MSVPLVLSLVDTEYEMASITIQPTNYSHCLISNQLNETELSLCHVSYDHYKGYESTDKNKQTPWSLIRKRTIPTEPPPLVGEI
jgi:hypothetical protein